MHSSLLASEALYDNADCHLLEGGGCYKQDGMKHTAVQRLPLIRLGLLTAAALAIHGYHLGVEDAEIFLPAAGKLLYPDLYPYAAEFFLSHERWSLFAPILAWTARLTHLSMDWTVFVWYVATIFATLVACWMLAAACFESSRAQWSAMLAVTAALTMPAANTGLLLMDPYVTARSFSTPLTVFVLAGFFSRRYLLASIAAVLTILIHPQMALYLALLGLMLWITRNAASAVPHGNAAMALAFLLPVDFRFAPAEGPYREALYARDFYFLFTWTWYDWLGLIAPLFFFAWAFKAKPRGTTQAFARLSAALIPFGLLSIAAAAVISSSHLFDMFARVQPLRCFHLITLVFLIFLGGLIGEYAGGIPSKLRVIAAPALCLSVAILMFAVERNMYPSSPHIEWPGMKTSSNAWVNTLLWIRQNTPHAAVFAVDSRYFMDAGVDAHGFRAISHRSELADYYKDGGAVAVFPNLAAEWKQMSDSTYGLNHFTAAEFTRLAQNYPVTWAVIHGAAPAGMDCPYQQRGYAVCRIPDAPGMAATTAAARNE